MSHMSHMSYSDSWPETITQAQAIRELRRHGLDAAEFFADCGEREEYTAEEVLAYMGY